MVLVLFEPSGKRRRSATDTNQLLSAICKPTTVLTPKYGHYKSLFQPSEGTCFCPHLDTSPLWSFVRTSATHVWSLSLSYATCTFLSLLIFSLPTLPLTSFRIFLFGLMRPENSPKIFFFFVEADLNILQDFTPHIASSSSSLLLLLLLLLLLFGTHCSNLKFPVSQHMKRRRNKPDTSEFFSQYHPSFKSCGTLSQFLLLLSSYISLYLVLTAR